MTKTAYETVIGLEIHAELNTRTKIFCGCENRYGEKPNSLCCPVCMGLPGALPECNQKVVESAILLGLAAGCRIHPALVFERKHYFYPDTPKAYQISQNAAPLCTGGKIDILVDGQIHPIRLAQIHIEEDAGKLVKAADTGELMADFNRCGVPLVEIVTKPDLRSAEEARQLMQEVALVLQYLEISEVKMQQGNLRADVNVSVRPVGQAEMGVRTELKNINSFGAVYRAIAHEQQRQIAVLEQGGRVLAETRRWDDTAGASYAMRSKQQAAEYCYFLDPELPIYEIPPQLIAQLAALVPELPAAKTERLQKIYGISRQEAGLLAESQYRAGFFEASASLLENGGKSVANWLLGDIPRILREHDLELQAGKLTPDNLAAMVQMVQGGEISNTAAKTLLEKMLLEGGPAHQTARALGLLQINNAETLLPLVKQVLAENPHAVQDYLNGKQNSFDFLLGQCMKRSKGQGNPRVFHEILSTLLAGG